MFKTTKYIAINAVRSNYAVAIMKLIFALSPLPYNKLAVFLSEYTSINLPHIQQSWLYAICLILALLILLYDNANKLQNLETPKFKLVFDQTPEFKIADTNRADGKISFNYRVGVKSFSPVRISDVKVTLKCIKGNGTTQYIGRNLRVAPDGLTDRATLNSNTEYFWLVEFVKEKSMEDMDDSDWSHAVRQILDNVTDNTVYPYFRLNNDLATYYRGGELNIVLSVTGDGSIPVEEEFCLKLENEKFVCERLENVTR